MKDVYVVQALAALKTKDIRFGTSITSPYQRHPAQLASTVQTLHELSDRVAVLSPNPGLIKEIIEVTLSRPRTNEIRDSKEFHDLIYYVRNVWGGSKHDERFS